MKFKQGTRRKAIEYEKDLVRYWKDHKTFEKSVEQRPKDNSYVFYDGPPFITGVPHHGTLLSSIVKDAVPRYWTMKGKRVERVWGWDCHGLPAEVYTEKKLGIKDKKEIGARISLEDYINACRDNMVQTGGLWEETIERIGRWVDFKDAYKTMDKEYMESIWWAFKELYDKGKIYEGEKVLMYCTRDATPISKAEVAMDNSYQDVTDPSVYVKFRLYDDSDIAEDILEGDPEFANLSEEDYAKEVEKIKSQPKTYLLAWTTTPWTLNANTAVVINKDIGYVKVEVDGEWLILAEKSLERVMVDEKHQPLEYKVIDKFKGEDIRDFGYEPLFSDRGEGAHSIWHGDFVTDEEGTGIAHQAPAYGEDDYNFSKEHNIPLVLDTDEEGFYTEGEWKGKQIWEANKEIAKTLHERGVVWKIDYIKHSYPHCWRCATKLMYRAVPSWFMDINGQRSKMLEQNQGINWFPPHIKHGRFEKTVESAPDWNLSRDRFWATAMPVWKGKDNRGNEHIKVVGSYAELKELSGAELDDYHRPWIDDVTFTIDGVEYRRIEKVIDGWFESGSMPFAQFHYPFENREKFEASFPGDFIAEYIAQTRTWFYYLHAIGLGLFGSKAFKNVVVTGTLAGNDGRKMSKSFGNYTDPNELMDKYSADALRFLLLSCPLLNGEDFSLHDKDAGDVSRKLNMVWNMYDFFTLYADVDGWEWDGKLQDPSGQLSNVLDQWIVARIHQLTEHVDKHMQAYDLPNALADILPFIDDASNWYVRRSRKRFWKSDNDSDKNDAYRTLHYVLVRLSIVMAPFTPFLAEELYRKLTDGESVHLLDWPEMKPLTKEQLVLIRHMADARFVITDGLSKRAAAGIKVRQPLASATLRQAASFYNTDEFDDIIKEELNIKALLRDTKRVDPKKTVLENVQEDNYPQSDWITLDTEITPALQLEGSAREVIRHVQNARKKAGLNVEDRIELSVEAPDELLRRVLSDHAETIKAETLAVELSKSSGAPYQETVKVNGLAVTIGITKV